MEKSRKRVLFVDDEPMVLSGLRRMLHGMRREWDMEFVASAREAIAALDQRYHDVLVTDLKMPGMGGAELLQEVMQNHPKTVRIVLTGESMLEGFLKTVGPAHQFLAKPCDQQILVSAVASACAVQQMLSTDKLKDLVSGLDTLPCQSPALEELMDELMSTSCSIRTVGEIIARDMGMTVKVLQLANSAFFSTRQRVSDPARAVFLLGIDVIRALVMTEHVFSQFGSKEEGPVSVKALWDHSMNVGTYARRIAVAESFPDAVTSEAFTAGLLHDMGKLILAEHLPEEYTAAVEFARRERIPQNEAELEVIGASHAAVGGYLAGLWGLPHGVAEAVTHHHRPADCPGSSFGVLTHVHVADALDHVTGGDTTVADLVDTDYVGGLGLADRLPGWEAECLGGN